MYGLNVILRPVFLDKMLKIWCEKKSGGGANARLPPPLFTIPDIIQDDNFSEINITRHHAVSLLNFN